MGRGILPTKPGRSFVQSHSVEHTASALRGWKSQLAEIRHFYFTIDLCEDVAAALNKADVENILWGSHLMQTLRVPINLDELCFVVPDSQLQKGVTVLQEHGLDICQDKTCPLFIKAEANWEESYCNPPVHFHLNPNTPEEFRGSDTLQLYTIEDVFLELPVGKGIDLTDGPSNNIIFANDVSLRTGAPLKGWGRFPSRKTPVRIPTWQRYLEALIINDMTSNKLVPLSATNGWFRELTYIMPLGDPERLGHAAFTQMLNSWLHRSPTAKEARTAARKLLSIRVPDTRPRPSLEIQTVVSRTMTTEIRPFP